MYSQNLPQIQTKEIAKEVKAQLKAKFKTTKFSVTSDHNSLRIEWTDGPRQLLVKEVVDPFCGYEGYHDGINYDYRSRAVEFKGQQTKNYLKYLSYDRNVSQEFLNNALQVVADKGVDISGLEVVEGGYIGDYENKDKAMEIMYSLSEWEVKPIQSNVSSAISKEVTNYITLRLSFPPNCNPSAESIAYLEKQGFYVYQRHGQYKAIGRGKEFDTALLDVQPVVKKDREIAIKFSDKPSKEVREALRLANFNWNKYEKIWESYDSITNWEFAQNLDPNSGINTPASTPSISNSKAKAEKLREIADAMQSKINDKLNPAIGQQRHTARRSRIASGIRQEGYTLEKQQELLYALADAHDNNYCPVLLANVSNRRQIQSLMGGASFPCWDNGGWWSEYSTEHRTRLAKIGIYESNFADAHSALMNLAKTGKDQERARQEKLRALESNVATSKIPGYFPTPPKVVQRLIELAEIKPSMRVWEPSAGSGAIADALLDLASHVYVSEINYNLREILASKGHDILCHDCFECNRSFERIVANPPWGKDAGESAAEHIQFYYSRLIPGGRLVAVCDEGVFFRSYKKDVEFREWLTVVNSVSEEIPDGAFLESDRPTGVRCRIVVISKPWDAVEPVTEVSTQITIDVKAEKISNKLKALNLLDQLEELDLTPSPQSKPQQNTLLEALQDLGDALDELTEALTKQSR